MPLTAPFVVVTATPARVRLPSTLPAAERSGSMPCRPTASAPRDTVNVSTPPVHVDPPNDDALRASSQVSIWRAETTGTPWACADATTASAATESP